MDEPCATSTASTLLLRHSAASGKIAGQSAWDARKLSSPISMSRVQDPYSDKRRMLNFAGGGSSPPAKLGSILYAASNELPLQGS